MPVWERYSGQNTLVAGGEHINTNVFSNTQSDENFESSDVVAVDGILTVQTDTDDLCGVRLLVLDGTISSGSITESDPAPHERGVWYSFFAARGPMVFRLRSKKTVPPAFNLWLETWKEQGSTSTKVNWGFHVLWVVKH